MVLWNNREDLLAIPDPFAGLALGLSCLSKQIASADLGWKWFFCLRSQIWIRSGCWLPQCPRSDALDSSFLRNRYGFLLSCYRMESYWDLLLGFTLAVLKSTDLKKGIVLPPVCSPSTSCLWIWLHKIPICSWLKWEQTARCALFSTSDIEGIPGWDRADFSDVVNSPSSLPLRLEPDLA